MQTYRQTRTETHDRANVEAALKRYLRIVGCTTDGKRRAAIARAATVPLSDRQRLVLAVEKIAMRAVAEAVGA